jgi:hypothetical protein
MTLPVIVANPPLAGSSDSWLWFASFSGNDDQGFLVPGQAMNAHHPGSGIVDDQYFTASFCGEGLFTILFSSWA